MERNTTPHPLTKALAALGWTQERLARESGVAAPTISFATRGLRGGKFSPASARKILDAIRAPLAAKRRPSPKIEDLIFPHASESKRKNAAA